MPPIGMQEALQLEELCRIATKLARASNTLLRIRAEQVKTRDGMVLVVRSLLVRHFT
jgi:hypothetical protein